MIPSLVSYITQREGSKFLKLRPGIDESLVTAGGLGGGDGISLYVHIPFCRTLCPFCCFNRYRFREDTAREYFRNLKRELDLYIERGFHFSNIYFGGGTPTLLMDELVDFIGYLRQRFAVAEVSLETNPNEINPGNIRALREAGVNRLSVGVQSFDDSVLRSMGRVFASGDEIKEALTLAQGEFETLNVDFVFNFPGQTVALFEADVATFKELGIDQATFYPLMPSPHKKNQMERRFNRVDMSRERAFYEVILRDVYEAGYHPSTVWCFSKGKRMIDEYIIEYDDYIGIGAGSVSIVRGNFYVNSFALDRYASLVKKGRLPVIGWRPLSHREDMRYYLLTKLFGLCLDGQDFRERFGAGIWQKLALELAFFRGLGLVEGSDRMRVTRRGMYPVSVMMRDFFAALNTLREHCIENKI